MQIDSIWLVLTGAVSAFSTGFVGWFFGRRKTEAETRSKQIDNDVKLSKHYAKLLDDLEGRYTAKLKSVEKLYAQREKTLKEENRILKRRNRLLQTENKELTKRNRLLEQKINELE